MAYEARSRTPGVSFGDKFLVAHQYVLTKEGPEQVWCGVLCCAVSVAVVVICLLWRWCRRQRATVSS